MKTSLCAISVLMLLFAVFSFDVFNVTGSKKIPLPDRSVVLSKRPPIDSLMYFGWRTAFGIDGGERVSIRALESTDELAKFNCLVVNVSKRAIRIWGICKDTVSYAEPAVLIDIYRIEDVAIAGGKISYSVVRDWNQAFVLCGVVVFLFLLYLLLSHSISKMDFSNMKPEEIMAASLTKPLL